MESDYGFDEYIVPTTYSEVPKLESYDAQLYPSGLGYMCDPSVMSAVPMTIPHHHHQPAVAALEHPVLLPSSPADSVQSCTRRSPPAHTPPLLSCSPCSSGSSSSGGVASAISEKIAQVNKLPESFLPEFHQYSKETYENGTSNSKKRRRVQKDDEDGSSSDQEEENDGISAAELRRQIHIQSEQKRRAQIKDGFEELRQHLPGCVNKKMSKAALLHRTVQHLQHLKSTQNALLAELERLANENEQLRKFQESVLQKQALDRMYQMGAM
ncbi:hypothetical protein VTP01DRAFT_4970 [Rhizomucor pusillus]|uniref:uncharacterized protein n=1 Tax=Rhizomucor pusillus TaxID=4840 RepID=UPI003742F6D3